MTSFLSFDTETCLMRPGKNAPELVCVTWQRPGLEPGISHHSDSKSRVKDWLQDDSLVMVGHNVAFDMAVLGAAWPDLIPSIFRKYETNLVTCTKIRQQLLDIAAGCYRGRLGDNNRWIKYGYSLDDLVHRLRGKRLQKDGWRLVYEYFLDTPLAGWDKRAEEVQDMARGWLSRAVEVKKNEWTGPWPSQLGYKDVLALSKDEPSGARHYPLEDARSTMDVCLWQESHAGKYLQDQYRQSYGAFALHLSSVWGIKTHLEGVAKFEAEVQEAYNESKAYLSAINLVRPDGVRDTKLAQQAMIDACTLENKPIPLTDSGKPSLDKESCENVDCEIIKQYSAYSTLSKVLSNDVQMLRKGTVFPVHPSYGMAESGRTTCSKPNIQNLRRKKGIREAFVPRPGKVFAQADYEGLELHTLGQACLTLLGRSKLAEQLNAGIDVHTQFASRILRIPYASALIRKKDKQDKEFDQARQVGKVFNFGKPGGMSDATMVDYAWSNYRVRITLEESIKYGKLWLEELPEMPEYFELFKRKAIGYGSNFDVEQLYTGRTRGECWFTAGCNTIFQGLGADCAKRAMCMVAKAQYVDRSSPLFGSRTVAFIHDELIVETDDCSDANRVALELGAVMKAAADYYLKDVPVRLEPLLMRVWSKDAKPIYENDRLVPWSPE